MFFKQIYFFENDQRIKKKEIENVNFFLVCLKPTYITHHSVLCLGELPPPMLIYSLYKKVSSVKTKNFLFIFVFFVSFD
jgi:hypothetical protein